MRGSSTIKPGTLRVDGSRARVGAARTANAHTDAHTDDRRRDRGYR